MDKQKSLQELEDWRNHFEWHYILDHYKPCLLLDFGCGYGYGDIHLATAGFEVVGYDIDEERIEIADYLRNQQPENVRNKVRFYLNAIPQRNYELIWLSHVLEHLPYHRWQGEFDLIWRSCDTHGTPILVSVPLGNAYDMPEHVNHWYTADELRERLAFHTGLKWEAWVDAENQVIKART